MSINKIFIFKAFQRVKPYIIQTPVLTNPVINTLCGASVYFKCENLQRIGAFKTRGAFNALLSLSRDELARGVATHSSGNHAQALALAASTLDVPATIVMPENSPQIKVEGVKRLGANLVFCKPTLQAREETLKTIIDRTKAVFIPPYDADTIIAGQSTATIELMEQIECPEAILAPLGGGGLLSGTALAAHYLSPDTKVYGAEPVNVNDGQRSFRSGKLESNPPEAQSIADGLRTHLSERTLNYIRQHVQDVLTVEEDEIIAAMQLIWQHLKLIVEPSAAVPLAAVLKNTSLFKSKRIAIILSGGNTDSYKITINR